MIKYSTKQNFLLFMKINLIQLIIAVVFAANAFAIPAKAQDMLQKKGEYLSPKREYKNFVEINRKADKRVVFIQKRFDCE